MRRLFVMEKIKNNFHQYNKKYPYRAKKHNVTGIQNVQTGVCPGEGEAPEEYRCRGVLKGVQ